MHGDIVFDNVEAAYTPDGEPVLRNISFGIEAGQKVAICGRTGSGKSSLLLALFGLLNIRPGSITIDSVSITTIPRSTLRSRLNVIPQDPLIFPGSVRLNALPHLNLTTSDDQDIVRALSLVGLWDKILSRGGLDVDMSEIALSQGEKQLFCLARAWLKRHASPILVLDEAMSNVDYHTGAKMEKIIREEWEKSSVISVVHRLDIAREVDKIAVLEGGRLVEFDSPDRLLDKAGGAFKALWDRHE